MKDQQEWSVVLAKVNMFGKHRIFPYETPSTVRKREHVFERPRGAFDRVHCVHRVFGQISSNVALDNHICYSRPRVDVEAH